MESKKEMEPTESDENNQNIESGAEPESTASSIINGENYEELQESSTVLNVVVYSIEEVMESKIEMEPTESDENNQNIEIEAEPESTTPSINEEDYEELQVVYNVEEVMESKIEMEPTESDENNQNIEIEAEPQSTTSFIKKEDYEELQSSDGDCEIIRIVMESEHGRELTVSDQVNQPVNIENEAQLFSLEADKEPVESVIGSKPIIKPTGSCLNVKNDDVSKAPNSSSKRKRKQDTGKDPMKGRESLPYFSTTKSVFNNYSEGVRTRSKSKKLTERPKAVTSNKDISSNVTKPANFLKQAIGQLRKSISDQSTPKNSKKHLKTVARTKKPSSKVTMQEKIAKETIGQLRKNITDQSTKQNSLVTRSSSPADDEIIFLGVVPSPSISMNDSFLHGSMKGSCKPNFNFAGERDVKRSRMEAETPGAQREKWKKELKEKIIKKKEATFIKKKQLQHIDNEDFELFEASGEDKEAAEDRRGGCSIKTNEKKRNLPFALGSSDGESLIESDLDYDADGDNDYESDFPEEIVCARESSDHREDDFLYSGSISFSLPSYQPCGGFANSDAKENTEEESLETKEECLNSLLPYSPISDNTKNDETREEDTLIPIITLTSSPDSDQKYGSHLKIDKELGHFLPHFEASTNHEFFDDSGVSQMCSGAFPSTPKHESYHYLSTERSEGDESSSQVHTEDDQSKITESPVVIRLKRAKLTTKRKRAIIESSDDEVEDDSNIICKETTGVIAATHTKKKKTYISGDEFEHLASNEPITSLDEICVSENALPSLSPESQKRLIEEVVTDSCLEEVFANKDNLIRGFIEDEAELSGEEQSSDEDETGLDLVEIEDAEVIENDEVLRKEIGELHLKQLKNDDDQLLKRIKNDFLDEGELYMESGEQRHKKFSWANKDLEVGACEARAISDSDDDDNAEHFDQQDKLKWMKENSSEAEVKEPAEAANHKRKKMKIDILNTPFAKGANKVADNRLKRKRGSLLNSDFQMMKKPREGTPNGSRKPSAICFLKNNEKGKENPCQK